MNNYEHEIECPENKGIASYLWHDYFHDSTVLNICFDRRKNHVTFEIECSRDMDKKYNELKSDSAAWEEYMENQGNNYIYLLTFKNSEYFHVERLLGCSDYLNGRFKVTALLKELQKESKRQLYHFRIQFPDGYADMIFSDFIIRKKQGRVKYDTNVGYSTTEGMKLLERDNTVKRAKTGDETERLFALHDLYKNKDADIQVIARENLNFSPELVDSNLYAAYILGKIGDESEYSNLMKLYFGIEKNMMAQSVCYMSPLLPRRNIMDAIELIQARRNS